jgi:hypothetical protein
MIVPVFLSIMLLLLISFCVTSKELHLFEIIFLWLTISLLSQTVSWMLIVNLDLLSIAKGRSYFFLHAIEKIIIDPLVTITFFDWSKRISHETWKYVFLVFTPFALILIEYIYIWTGVLEKKHWNIGYSLIEWFSLIAVSYRLWPLYRKKLGKEV